MDRIFLPGSRIGVMGGGQLGRMFAIAARRMGYRVHTFSPDEDTPTGQLADVEIAAAFDDLAAVESFARSVDVITFEFENIPSATVELCSRFCVVRPSGRILHITQQRLREKNFLAGSHLPVAEFRAVHDLESLRHAVEQIGLPAILKSAEFGYDGKGQQRINPSDELPGIWECSARTEAVLEACIPFEKEISVLVARGLNGSTAVYPVCENIHRHHILDLTMAPADLPEAVAGQARGIAVTVAEKLELVGLLAVEMFVMGNGEILINELAPRPHNSGHFSFDASMTSQFEQQLRAVCGLPLGSTESFRPAAMANLLGDLWERGEPDFMALARFSDVKLHLYGKAEARPGRKMGHLVAFGDTGSKAATRVLEARHAFARHAN